MGKQEMRKQLAALSFTEKVKILEKLRDRSLAFAEARRKRKARTKAMNVSPNGDQR
jgi:hypothetical protein